MKYTKTFALLLLHSLAAQAQQPKTVVHKQSDTIATWQQLDSLSHTALLAEDTSSAITYYEEASNLHPAGCSGNAMLERIRKHYRHAASSFYLKEY